MELPLSESEVDKEAHCSTDLQPSSPTLESRGNVVKEPSTLLQLRTHYRKLIRMHPYADEKMKLKEMCARLFVKMNEKSQQKSQELEREMDLLRNNIKSYEEQINWQEEHIKTLDERLKSKDDRIKSLEQELEASKTEEKKFNTDKIKEYEEQIKIQNERIKSLEKKLEADAAKEPPQEANTIQSKDEIIKSQDDRIQLLEKEVMDLTYRVKKQEVQIQFLELDMKYKDNAQSAYSENVQRQEIKIQFLEVEVNYRKNKEDALKQDKERLENENLSLSNILKEMKSADGCSSSEDFCCETVKQVRLSFIDLIETEFECIICNGMFIEATITPCNHMFCNHCLYQWKKKSPHCPICRSFIRYDIKTTIIDNYIMNAAKLISEKMLNDRKKALEERKEAKNIAKYKRLRV